VALDKFYAAAETSLKNVDCQLRIVDQRLINQAQKHNPQAEAATGLVEFWLPYCSKGVALDEIRFSNFAQGLRNLAEYFDGTVNMPDMPEAMQHAQGLSHFFTQHHIELSLNLVCVGAAWAPALVQHQLSEAAFKEKNGLYLHAFADVAHAIRAEFKTSHEHVQRVSLMLKIPLLRAQAQPLQRLRQVADQLAKRLPARVIDERGEALDDAAWALIAQHLHTYYQAMEAGDIAAGSVRALRVFADTSVA
jgi:hypothetical protein